MRRRQMYGEKYPQNAAQPQVEQPKRPPDDACPVCGKTLKRRLKWHIANCRGRQK